MNSTASPTHSQTHRHVLAAAKNIAAAQFALHGFDVLYQPGRDSYSYDLGVASADGMMKIMVLGCLDGLWDLVEPYLVKTSVQKDDYHRAIDLWLARHRYTTCCVVQFDSSNLCGMPCINLAIAGEVAEVLHENAEAIGELAPCTTAEGPRGASSEDCFPPHWRFSLARIWELMPASEGRRPMNFQMSRASDSRDYTERYPADCAPLVN